jgi:hypothetical protein
MKKSFSLLFVVLVAALFTIDIAAQSFFTGGIGVTQSNGGRTRVFSDNLTTRQIDRTSVLVGVSHTAVFDYNQDQQGIVNAVTVTNPPLSDFEVTSTIDNSYNVPALPPNVEVKFNIYGWNNGAYLLVKLNVKNREASAINAVIGLEVIPQVDGAYGGETVQWNSANKTVLINKTKWVGYKFFSGMQTSLRSFPWVSAYGNDSLYYTWLTQNSFDPPLTAEAVVIMGQAAVNIPANSSTNFWYGIALGDNQAGVLANIAACESKYVLTVPVELTSFTAALAGNKVNINWSTATEVNNLGFEVERRTENSEWITVAYKSGSGTTTAPQAYSVVDDIAGNNSAKLYYRLKQIDFNGVATYYDEVEVTNLFAPQEFLLGQNYPNPFNPSTKISFGIPERSSIMLKVYNSIGEEVALIAGGIFEAGTYTFDFNASSLPSGNYVYVLQTDNSVISKKMTLIK